MTEKLLGHLSDSYLFLYLIFFPKSSHHSKKFIHSFIHPSFHSVSQSVRKIIYRKDSMLFSSRLNAVNCEFLMESIFFEETILMKFVRWRLRNTVHHINSSLCAVFVYLLTAITIVTTWCYVNLFKFSFLQKRKCQPSHQYLLSTRKL